MSIMPLKRATLIATQADKPALLRDLQALGCMHLESLRPTGPAPEEAAPEHADDARQALRWLQETPRQRRQILIEPEFDVADFVAKVLANKQAVRDTGDALDTVLEHARALVPWGDFELPEEGGLDGQLLWFYVVPLRELDNIPRDRFAWELVHRDHRFGYVVVVSEEEPPHDAMPVPRTHTGAESRSTLARRQEMLEVELEGLAAQRESLTHRRTLLQRNMDRAEDQAVMRHASEQTLETQDGLCLLQGWVPAAAAPALEDYANTRSIALTLAEPTPKDRPPTLLKNPPKLSGGQDLLGFYETPAYRTWDPSTIIFFSFTTFFAMILSDAGYGLTLGCVLAFFWKRMGESETGLRMRVLMSYLVGATIVYGMMVGSYFGVSPAEGSLLGAFKILDINDYDTMMRISILIGAMHIVLANAMMAYHAPYPSARGKPLGWCAAVVGGVALWFGATGIGPPAAMESLGTALIVGGLVAVVWFGDPQPTGGGDGLLKRLGKGLMALTDVTKLFGDVLSYMRLFALGLASASLALTFNELAGQVREAVPGLGVLLALLILVLGHVLNLGLSIMSGVVHGLRLNVLEFLNWSVSDEGYPFKPFARKETR
jgi:V/A-type H+-transporting ATPase subunit I